MPSLLNLAAIAGLVVWLAGYIAFGSWAAANQAVRPELGFRAILRPLSALFWPVTVGVALWKGRNMAHRL